MFLKIAILIQTLLIIYYQMIAWIDLYPWNNISYNNHLSVHVVVCLVQIFVLAGFFMKKKWIMKLGFGFYLVWLLLHFYNWWISYLFGPPPEMLDLYQLYFSGTYKFLPALTGIFIPDANHVTLQFLMLLTLISIGKILFARKDSHLEYVRSSINGNNKEVY